MKIKELRIVIILCVVTLMGACSGQSSTHLLFESGKSAYTIVIDPESSECVHYAAEELQTWIKQISGVTIPIAEDLSAGQSGKRIVVGYNKLTVKRIKDASAPDGMKDSFTYVSKGGDLFFWGDTDRGTLYSVYSFLENEFGCRWFNSRTSLIPERDSWSFVDIFNHEVPALRIRDMLYYDVYHQEFAARLRLNITRDKRYGGGLNYYGGHALEWYVSAKEYFESHPEYFGLIDGKRNPKSQRCLSNPDVLKVTVEAVKKVMREQPDNLIYSVEQGDGIPSCECENCRAIRAEYGDQESGVMIWFANQVADAVKDEFPDKFIGTFAYQQTRHCPENIKPRDNVVIRLCSIEECQMHKYDECEQNRDFLKDLEGWPSIADHLYIWDYTTTFSNYLLPSPNFWTFQDRMKRFRDAKAMGVMPQGSYQSTSTAFEDMKVYLLSRLLWNPDCDVDAVIKDFTDGFFGPDAGPIIREYLAFEKTLVTEDNHEDLYMSEDADLFNDAFIAPAKAYFTRAKEAVRASGGDQVEELIARVEYAEAAICTLELLRMPKQGRADGSLDILKRVIEREGVTIYCEFGDKTKAQDLIDRCYE